MLLLLKLTNALAKPFDRFLLMGVMSLLGDSRLQQQLPIIELRLEVDEVPVLYEMPSQVNHTLPSNLHCNVVPRHSW